MGKGKVKPFQALKGQPNFTSCSKYSKIVCSMNLPREGDVVNSYLVVIVGYALFLILLGYGIGKHVKGASDFLSAAGAFPGSCSLRHSLRPTSALVRRWA